MGKAHQTKPMQEYKPGDAVFTIEFMGDGEFRETFYIIDPARPCRYECNIPVGRFGFVQGNPTDERPRVIRISKEACRDPGEADGRTPCLRLESGVSHFYERTAMLRTAVEGNF